MTHKLYYVLLSANQPAHAENLFLCETTLLWGCKIYTQDTFKSCFNLFYLATWGELKTLTLSPYKVAECECVTDAFLHVHRAAPAFIEKHFRYSSSIVRFVRFSPQKRWDVVQHVNKKKRMHSNNLRTKWWSRLTRACDRLSLSKQPFLDLLLASNSG